MGQVAARSGVAISTIHFYESKGLIRGWRNKSNHRRYARAVLRRVALIKVAQRTGISLASIRAALKARCRRGAPQRRRIGRGFRRFGEMISTTESNASRGFETSWMDASVADVCHSECVRCAIRKTVWEGRGRDRGCSILARNLFSVPLRAV